MDVSDLANDAERRLWDAFPRGELVNLGEGNPAVEGFDPATWGPQRTIRAEVIARLLLGALPGEPGYTAKVHLEGVVIQGILDLNDSRCDYELWLKRCWLDTAPYIRGAHFRALTASACHLPGLNADRFYTAVLDLRGTRFTGEVRLVVGHVGGQLELGRASLYNERGPALIANRLTVDGNLVFQESRAIGEVRLFGARIGGRLDLSGASLHNEKGNSLYADGLTVGGDMSCRHGFRAVGEVRLPGAHVGGKLDLSGASLSNENGYSLFADGFIVDGDMSCGEGFCAVGEVRLPGAHIGGQLDLSGASLHNDAGRAAFTADRLAVGGDILCRDGFRAVGEVTLPRARIGGQLDLSGASLCNRDGLALTCENVQTDQLILNDASVTGEVDLRRGRLGQLRLPALAGMPRMLLDGLTYTDLADVPDVPVRQMVKWLCLDRGYHPQPYEQLAGYYMSIGHDGDARMVLLQKRRAFRRRQFGNWPGPLRAVLGRLLRLPGLLLDVLSGYGYVPKRAFCWLVAALLAGWLGLRPAPLTGPTGSGSWNTLLYVVDALVPTSPFGLENQIQLHGSYLGWSYGLQVVGWALSIAIIPSITRALGRAGTPLHRTDLA